MKKMLLVINPRSGKMAVKGHLLELLQIFRENDWLTTVLITKAKGEASEITYNAEKSGEYDAIVCCGGDGTLSEVINGVVRSGGETPVGYIPAGSTNDFAISTKIPTDLYEAARYIGKGEKTVSLDAGKFNKDRVFNYIASFGAFTATSYNVPQNIKNSLGHFAYLLAGIKDIASVKPYKVSVTTEEKTCEGDYIFGAVCNSFSVGGIIKLTNKDISLNDGKFEVLLVKMPKNPVEVNKILWGFINMDFSDEDVFEFFKAEKVEFTMPEGVDWSLDGEFEKGSEDVLIENINSAFKLITE